MDRPLERHAARTPEHGRSADPGLLAPVACRPAGPPFAKSRPRPGDVRGTLVSAAADAVQLEVERFLYREAMLLDAWRLEEWLALFSPQARYIVPSTDHPQGNPPEHPALIDDDFNRLQGRVTRLLSRRAHREYPSSRTRHLVSNVLIIE